VLEVDSAGGRLQRAYVIKRGTAPNFNQAED
jgi:hypothetical protein